MDFAVVDEMQFSLRPKPFEASPPGTAQVVLLMQIDVPPDRKDHPSGVTQKKPRSEKVCHRDSDRDEGNRIVPHHMLLAVHPLAGKQTLRWILFMMSPRMSFIDLSDAIMMTENAVENRLKDCGEIIRRSKHRDEGKNVHKGDRKTNGLD